MKLLLNIIAFVFLSFFSQQLFAQTTLADSNYIYRFKKRNVFELYPGFSTTRFNFTKRGQFKNDYSLVANKSAYIGMYFGYKWFSLKYSWAIPGTSLDKNVKLQYTSFLLNFAIKKWNLRPFYNSYNGLLIPENTGPGDFKPIRDIKFSDAGIDVYYFFHTKRFSVKAANSFFEKQIKSTGSLFLKVTPMWQKIKWKDPSRDLINDSTTYALLSSDPEWISIIARVGYNYNISFKKGKWSIVPFIVIGGGALREINTGIHTLQLVTDIQAGLRTGYNGHNNYYYLNARWGNLQTNLLIKNMHQVNTNISITAGHRFGSLKNKIFGIL